MTTLSAAGSISFGTVLNTSVVVTLTGITGGTTPYTVQFQRAPDVSGSPGTYANVGVAISTTATSLSYSDGSVAATTKYWYQAIVTDATSTSLTATGNYVVTSATAATLDTLNAAIQSVLAILQAGSAPILGSDLDATALTAIANATAAVVGSGTGGRSTSFS